MTQDELIAFLSQANPEIVNAILSGEIPLDVVLQQLGDGNNELLGFDISRIQITENQYFDNSRTEIIDEQGRIGKIHTLKVWDCGHSQMHYEFGGIDSFGKVLCVNCLSACDVGRHPCSIWDIKILSNGQRACFCHRGIYRFSNKKFNKYRVR